MSEQVEPASTEVERFRVSRRGNLTTRRVEGKPELTKRDRLLLEWVCYGLPRRLAHWPDITPGIPLSVAQAGDMLGLRKRYVRDLTAERVWQEAIASEVKRIRDGSAVRAIRRIVATIDHEGDKAADAKVRLEAAQTILGDTVGKSAVTVNVQTNVQTNVTPGYVLDLAPQAPAPARGNVTIDSEALK